MNDFVMMDTESYSMVGSDGIHTNSMQCDDHHGELDESRQSATPITNAVALPSMVSNYAPAEMENALRIMTHAGRILWRAAMEAIPGGLGSYNPSISVLSKLWKLSFGKKENDSKTRNILSALSIGKPNAAVVGVGEKTTCTADEGDEHYDVVQTIPDCMYDSYNLIEVHEALGDNFQSQPKKRKSFFRISSLLPSVVSDSEEEEDSDRPSKRIRRSFDDEHAGCCW